MAANDRSARPAPGVAEVRLSGMAADTDALLAVLEAAPGVEILTRSAAYANRRSPGQRVYLVVRIMSGSEPPQRRDQRAAALAARMSRKKGDAR